MAMNRGIRSIFDAARRDASRGGNRRLLILAAAGLLAWGVLGGSQGLLALVLSQREKSSLREEIESLERENRQLQQQVALLESRPDAYEKTARERLLLMRPGEIIYRFQ